MTALAAMAFSLWLLLCWTGFAKSLSCLMERPEIKSQVQAALIAGIFWFMFMFASCLNAISEKKEAKLSNGLFELEGYLYSVAFIGLIPAGLLILGLRSVIDPSDSSAANLTQFAYACIAIGFGAKAFLVKNYYSRKSPDEKS